jgi:hypothetical protein
MICCHCSVVLSSIRVKVVEVVAMCAVLPAAPDVALTVPGLIVAVERA